MKVPVKKATWIIGGLLLLSVYGLFVFHFAQTTKIYRLYHSSPNSGVSYEKAVVLAVEAQELGPDDVSHDLTVGYQDLKVQISSGSRSGTVTTIRNVLNYTTNVLARAGDTVILHLDTADRDHWLASLYSSERAPFLLVLVSLFALALCCIGGWRGVKSVVGIAFTFVTLIFLFIPMLYRGYSPVASAFLVTALTAVVSLFLLNGPCGKTWAAIVGTCIGVALAALVAALFQNLTQVSGLNEAEADSLLAIGGKTGLQVGGLLFASILVASLGAVMDIAISVASAVSEVYRGNPLLDRKQLFRAGMSVGRDTMGTMANTLILAFVGSSLSTIVLLYSLQSSYNQIANSALVAMEVVKAFSGSLGVVLTVPAVAFIAAVFIPWLDRQKV